MAKEYRVNYQIKARQVDLVLPDGTMKKSVPFSEAITIAQEKDLDVVELSEGTEEMLPICKVIDYGKMLYQQNKKKKATQQMQHIKEIRYRFNIADHDLAVKHKKVLEFLSKHYTVKYALELKGREKSLVDRGLQKLQQNLEEFRELALWKDPYVSMGSNGAEISTVLHAK